MFLYDLDDVYKSDEDEPRFRNYKNRSFAYRFAGGKAPNVSVLLWHFFQSVHLVVISIRTIMMQRVTDLIVTRFSDWLDSFVQSGVWWALVVGIVGVLHLQFPFLLAVSIRGEQEDLPLPPSPSSGVVPQHVLTFALVVRGVALANTVAFLSFLVQCEGLIGESGVQPVREVLGPRREFTRADAWGSFASAPTLFSWLPGNAVQAVCIAGVISSLLLVFVVPVVPGGTEKSFVGGTGTTSVFDATAPLRLVWMILPACLWLLCGLLYLSLLTVAGDFLGLQSDSNLVEIDALLGILTALGFFVGPGRKEAICHAAILVLRFFCFRKMLACGICKFYGSPMWRRYTAMEVHYFTQPLPSPVSFYAHNFPTWAHKLSVVATFVIEILCPFLVFLPDMAFSPVLNLWRWLNFQHAAASLEITCGLFRLCAIAAFGGLNAMINLTGNYGFIGFLNTMENFAVLDDRVIGWFFPPLAEKTNLLRRILLGGVAEALLLFPHDELHATAKTKMPIGGGGPMISAGAVEPFLHIFGSCLRACWVFAVGVLVLIYVDVSLVPLMTSAKGHVSLRAGVEDVLSVAQEVFRIPVRTGMDAFGSVVQTSLALVPPLIKRRFDPVHHLVHGNFRSIDQFEKTLSRLYRLQRRFHLVNYQGKFSGMHDYRWEVVFEGKLIDEDGTSTGGADTISTQRQQDQVWREFAWKYKPNNFSGTARPLFCPLHLPRLDWRVWFLPLQSRGDALPPDWFYRTIQELQQVRFFREARSRYRRPP